jgi:Helicase conserved C-terminal domain
MDARIGCAGHHNRKHDAEAAESQPVVRLRPPDLIIQDELHLIAGALGTTVGLFEAAVDELCTWRLDDHEVGPKIVASTATVKRAAEQALQLFARDLAIFPPPVLDQGDTFFSRQETVTPESPGRRYLGVCAHGVRLKSAEIKLAEILLIAGQYLLDQHGAAADPYLTLVGYFNATRELAGMRRYLDDDIATRVRRNGHRRGLADRLATMKPVLAVQELTSRVSSAVIGQALRQLEVAFDPVHDSTAVLEAMRQEVLAVSREKRDPRLPPKRDLLPTDVVLATSMLQVGVDVQRLGLMVVTGQPKNTAEYLQATGRVGRDPARPGLVVMLYNWARPRDLAHYEHFAHYHATAAKDVEALSVTPYARRALDREFAATFIAVVRNLDERYSRNRDAHDLPLDGQIVTKARRGLRRRASIASGSAFDGAGYLDEKAEALLDEWARQRASTGFRLGFQSQKTATENIEGLLRRPEQGEWTALTVGMSMRETENEVNLLLPRQTLADIGAATGPGWVFGAPGPERDEDIPAGDELGEAT